MIRTALNLCPLPPAQEPEQPPHRTPTPSPSPSLPYPLSRWAASRGRRAGAPPPSHRSHRTSPHAAALGPPTRARTAAARSPPWSPASNRPTESRTSTPPIRGAAAKRRRSSWDRVGAGLPRRRRREVGRRGHGWGGTPVGRLRAGGDGSPEYMKFCVSRDGSAHSPKQRTAGVKGGCWGRGTALPQRHRYVVSAPMLAWLPQSSVRRGSKMRDAAVGGDLFGRAGVGRWRVFHRGRDKMRRRFDLGA